MEAHERFRSTTKQKADASKANAPLIYKGSEAFM